MLKNLCVILVAVGTICTVEVFGTIFANVNIFEAAIIRTPIKPIAPMSQEKASELVYELEHISDWSSELSDFTCLTKARHFSCKSSKDALIYWDGGEIHVVTKMHRTFLTNEEYVTLDHIRMTFHIKAFFDFEVYSGVTYYTGASLEHVASFAPQR